MLLACVSVASSARAQGVLTTTGPVRVSDTATWMQYAIGDREPGVVPTNTPGTVFIAWIHHPETSHRSDSNTLQHATLTVGATPALGGRGMQAVTGLGATVLAVTRDATGPIQVFGAYESDGVPWVVGALRPGDLNAPPRLEPRDGVSLDVSFSISALSVPRVVSTAPDGFLRIPLGLTLTDSVGTSDALQSAEIGTDAMLMPRTPLLLGQRSPPGPRCTITERAASIGPTGVFLDLQGGMFAVHPVSGSPTVPYGAPSADTWPGFGTTADGTLAGIEQVNSIPILFCQLGVTASPFACGMLDMPLGEIDLAADAQYAQHAWFVGAAGRECLGSARFAPYMVVGDTHDPGNLASLDTSMMARCSHPRISAVPGESVSGTQHAIVVASCMTMASVATIQLPEVYAWIVERPPLPDAGTDAGPDASDAVTPGEDAPAVDAGADDAMAIDATPGSSPRSGPSFRGSGCACRAGDPQGPRSGGGRVLVAAAIAMALARSRRRTTR